MVSGADAVTLQQVSNNAMLKEALDVYYKELEPGMTQKNGQIARRGFRTIIQNNDEQANLTTIVVKLSRSG